MPTILARPLAVDLDIYAGDDFTLDLTVTNSDGSPADLTGVTAKSDIRRTIGNATVLASFTATIAANVITLYLPAATTAQLPATAVWDCQITGTMTTTLVAGAVRTDPQVTT